MATATEEKAVDVTLPKEQFDAIMARLNRLENPGVPQRIKREKEHYGHLRMWEGQLVIRIGGAKENLSVSDNHPDRLTIDIGVISVTGETVKKTLNYLDFVSHAPKVRVKFVKEERLERTEVDMEKGGGGIANKRLVDKNGWASDVPTGEELALEVGFIDVSLDVEVVEGDYKGQIHKFEPKFINAINA